MLKPQPLGIFPFPANYLVLPESWQENPEYKSLVYGIFPRENSFYKFAIDGEIEKAIENLSADDSLETKYNRFVLQPSQESYSQLKEQLTGELKVLLDAVAFTLHFISEPPSAENIDGEVLGIVLLAQATQKIELGETSETIRILSEAVEATKTVSPVFSALIKANLAETRHQVEGGSAEIVTIYKQSIETLQKTELEETFAALYLNLGICYQEMSNGNRGLLLEAVKCYQECLKYISRETHPEQFAFTQNNLALAYLSTPLVEASDQLRVAIAIQALRDALSVYTKETHGELWASTQLNLANALVYAPSGHREENLMEAVNLYEEILVMRQPTVNPVGYARVLANQGNTLAHLGIFKHAIPKLTEAKDIFTQIGETDSANSIQEVLDEIEQSKNQQTSEATA